jgi:hypothetical protein
VLWTHVDDHRLIFTWVSLNFGEQRNVGFAHAQHRANLAHYFFGREFAA